MGVHQKLDAVRARRDGARPHVHARAQRHQAAVGSGQLDVRVAVEMAKLRGSAHENR